MTTSNHGRTPLPCGQVFGRRYACCHRDETRTWLTIQVRCVDASLNAVTSISIKHPLCCQQGWAVSCLHMGIRRILRTALKEQALFRDTDNHVRSLLFSHLAKPEYASYWELAHELAKSDANVDRTDQPLSNDVVPLRPSSNEVVMPTIRSNDKMSCLHTFTH